MSLKFWVKTKSNCQQNYFLSNSFGPFPVHHYYFFFYPRGGKMERKAFVFRLNCLYIQHLKYILFCCTLVSKCIRFYWNIKRHLKPDSCCSLYIIYFLNFLHWSLEVTHNTNLIGSNMFLCSEDIYSSSRMEALWVQTVSVVTLHIILIR